MNIFKSIINKLIYSVLVGKGKRTLAELARDSEHAVEYSQKLLMKLIRESEDTEYGKAHHFSEIHSIEDYKRLVPLSTYDDYAPYIQRITDFGETGLITNTPIVHYAASSGSVGVPKSIPVSQATLDLYADYAGGRPFSMVEDYYKTNKGRRSYRGAAFNMLEVIEEYTKCGVPRGNISSTMVVSYKPILPFYVTSPEELIFPKGVFDKKYVMVRFALVERDVAFMTAAFMNRLVDHISYIEDNWRMLVEDIEKGTINEDIQLDKELRAILLKKIKPNPKRAAELRAEFEKGFDSPIVPRIWPKISWISCIGTASFATYTEKMRTYLGDDVPIDFQCYGASEALMAVAREVNKGEFVLIPKSGFYEFIPADSEEDTTYTIDQLEVGKDYEIILTNLSGFYRYKIKDVVHVLGFYKESPIVAFAYRKNQVINLACEKTNEESLRYAVNEFAKATGCSVLDFSVYPDTDHHPARYVMFMETDKIMPKEKHAEYTELIREKLNLANPYMAEQIKAGLLAPAVLHFVEPETYALFRELQIMRGASANQVKPVRLIDTPVKEKFFFGLIEQESEGA